jgi:hypothetical protein
MIKTVSKECLLILTLVLFSILINWPILTFPSMYTEQPIIYLANQSIHSFKDFFNVYLHPHLLEMEIPFFRPSGHFLMYQLLTPLFGWDNLVALLTVNFLFLGVIGYLIIKIYEELFPGFQCGGFVAFSFYLMNPALIISRVTLMHFEYAYVMFLLLGLYCFMLFCKKNLRPPRPAIEKIKFQHFNLLLWTAIFYFIAISFKEPAIMLGPVAMCYFLLALYDTSRPLSVLNGLKNKEIIYTILFFLLMSVTFALYLTDSWIGWSHPLRERIGLNDLWGTIKEFSRFLFSLKTDPVIMPQIQAFVPNNFFRAAITPQLTHYIVWALLTVTAISMIKTFFGLYADFKKSIIFLIVALLLFLILPLGWSMGYGWHLSLSLVCESLLLGFGFEFFLKNYCKNANMAYVTGIIIALAIGLTTYNIDRVNIDYISTTTKGFAWKVTYNAVFHPPALKNQLNANSLLIVEDSKNLGDYELGDSTYPLMLILTKDNFDKFNFNDFYSQDKVFVHIDPVYDSTLFRWAYHMPALKEQMVSFDVFKLKAIPDRLLSSWLRRMDNIFDVAYDKNGVWFDNTATFKKNLLLEQQRRHLSFSQYHETKGAALSANAVLAKNLPYPDAEICQSSCDADKSCKGFTYINASVDTHFIARCFFYDKVTADTKPCKVCTGFIKTV